MSSTGFALSQHFADVMVNVHKSCFSSAIAELNLTLSAENSITLIDSNFTTTVGVSNTCNVDRDYKVISVSPFVSAFTTRFDDVLKPKSATQNMTEFTAYKNKIKAVIAQFISIDVVSKCIAVAVSSITLKFNALKSITITGLNIEQTVKAVIRSCVQNTRVTINQTQKTIQQAVDAIVPKVPVEVTPVDPAADAAENEKAQKELEDFNAFLEAWKPTVDPCITDNTEKITMATSVGMTGVIVMIIVLVIVVQYKKKLSKR